MIRFFRILMRIAIAAVLFVLLIAVTGYVFYSATLFEATAPQKGCLALVHATVLAGAELVPYEDTTVLIRDGIIEAVGADNEIDIPEGSAVHDLRGYTLMPGLIDLHVHMGFYETERGQEPGPLAEPKMIADWIRFTPDKRRALLEHGVTAVRSLGDEYQWIMDFRKQIENGVLEGPRLFAAGPMFTTPGGHPVATFGTDPASDSVRLPSTPEEARRMVRELAEGEKRVDLIKVVQERGMAERPLQPIAPDVLDAIVTEAHDQGLPVTAHWGTWEDLKDVLIAGVDGLEHLEPRGALTGWPEEELNLILERGIPLSPTLTVTSVALPDEIHEQLRQRAGEFYAAGGHIVTGTDAGMPGVFFGSSIHRELELLVESGMTPQEALIAATSEAAKVLRDDRIGSIAPGRAADLIVLKGDPLKDIRNADHIVMVFRDGRLAIDHR